MPPARKAHVNFSPKQLEALLKMSNSKSDNSDNSRVNASLPNVVVRETVEADLEDVFRIRVAPEVSRFQYPIRHTDTMANWMQILTADQSANSFFVGMSTVLFEDKVVGNISHTRYKILSANCVQCGWNLAPSFWGRGIMSAALRQKFTEFFQQQKIDHLFADCFSNNHRCIRLLGRLSFVRQHIPFYERLMLAYRFRCLKRVVRFRLDSNRWLPN